jgi:hypothetical protein
VDVLAFFAAVHPAFGMSIILMLLLALVLSSLDTPVKILWLQIAIEIHIE